MALFITADRALWRVIEDPDVPIGMRIRALNAAKHIPIILLRRLILDNKTRAKPVPARLKALATLRYAQAYELRRLRKLKKQQSPHSDNALGI